MRMREKKAKNSDPRPQQIYNLKALSKSHRDRFYGPQWFQTARQLYELGGSGSATGASPSWRPDLNIPQFQVLMMNEATDLAGINPRVIITQRGSSQRDRERERAFQDHWQMIGAPISLLMAELWALFAGIGWLWSGFDPAGYGGNGQVWLNWIDPEFVYPDPFAKLNAATGILDWSYVIIETELSIDEIHFRYAHLGQGPGALVTGERAAGGATGAIPQVGASPPFPTQTIFGPSSPPETSNWDAPRPRTSTVPVNIAFVKDYAEKSEAGKGNKVGQTGIEIPPPRLKYPWGRMLVESDSAILYDDLNPWGGMGGRTLFPVVPIWPMAPLTGVWAPPPARLSLGLQTLAAKMYAQLYENMHRTNNATTFVSEATGINTEDMGMLPAEIIKHAAGSPVPQAVWPQQMPQHMMAGPDKLMELGRILQGFPPSRMGEAGRGNVSPDLFEASIGQSKQMTQLRAMLLYQSLQCVAEILYYSMSRFYKTSRLFPSFSDEGKEGDISDTSQWEVGGDDSQVLVHPGSISVVSESAMKRYVFALRQSGLISRKSALDLLEVPHAEDIAEEVEKEEILAALAKVKRR